MKNSETPLGIAFTVAFKNGDDEDEREEGGLPEEVTNKKIELAPAEAKYVEAMFEIVEEYGKLADDDDNGIWVGYVEPQDNENKQYGVKCSNCAFWCPEMKGCHIIVEKAQADGYCRLAAIGHNIVKTKKRTR